jgi:hypothetical protein
MNLAQWAVAMSIGLFVMLMVCLEFGYRIGRRHSERHHHKTHIGVGAIEAAVFALLGLLLGFSFAGGTSRLDARRQMIVQEANAIGTSYLRLDLLPTADQPEMRRLFREYLDARIEVYDKVEDRSSSNAAIAHAEQLQKKIWSRAIASGQADPSQNVTRVLLPALNEMIDITTSRTIALDRHLPGLIFALLVCVALLSGLLAGYAMAERTERSWLHMIVYALLITLTVYAVLDLDYSRSGLIRLDAADHAMVQLRDSIR